MKLLSDIEKIVHQAGDLILSAKNIENVTQEKTSAADLVTEYDRKTEDFLKIQLLNLIPDAIFYGEEETQNQDPTHGWAFIVDPIDGTANFIRNLAQSAISVALAYNSEIQYAVILNPYQNELFSAKRKSGAYLNGKPIHVSNRPISQGIFGMGTAPYNSELHEKTLRLTWQLFQKSCDFRRMGSAALDLCAVACGRLDAFFEYQLSPWDYAAGSLLITEAGGYISSLEGNTLPLSKKSSVWASNSINFSLLSELNV